MYNRYQGNSGKFVRVQENHNTGAQKQAEVPKIRNTTRYTSGSAPAIPSPLRLPSFLSGGIGKLLSGSIGELETEDIILLLILYLMYRESGDSELLIMMGAMFLL